MDLKPLKKLVSQFAIKKKKVFSLLLSLRTILSPLLTQKVTRYLAR